LKDSIDDDDFTTSGKELQTLGAAVEYDDLVEAR